MKQEPTETVTRPWQEPSGSSPASGSQEGLTQSSGPHCEGGQEAVDRLAVEALERVERRAPGVQVTADVLPEETVPVLRRASAHAHALVVGSRGRGMLAGVLLGSVSLAVRN
ncbi:universal stress protein [Streptomyces zagrosensis]|uniref:Nucleotide-binding universal stress UspA family protein n=1 Tax=Streptomyces zagrosensis TaxID=1042984 RepID=A0A7W9QG68_9ACTN|nr:universal stress protein [Streptomyces zagrosensis]MBB5938422.1 nucleotide-binding universal stress UspA family protein [Streptomyces zagrosensis]